MDNNLEIELKAIYGRIERLEHFVLDSPTSTPAKSNEDERCNNLRRRLHEAEAEIAALNNFNVMQRRVLDVQEENTKLKQDSTRARLETFHVKREHDQTKIQLAEARFRLQTKINAEAILDTVRALESMLGDELQVKESIPDCVWRIIAERDNANLRVFRYEKRIEELVEKRNACRQENSRLQTRILELEQEKKE